MPSLLALRLALLLAISVSSTLVVAQSVRSKSKAKGQTASGTTGEWPQWRGPDRTNISRERGLRKNWDDQPPSLVWQADGVGGGYSSVSIAGGRIYTLGSFRGDSGETQGIVCVEQGSGKVLWKQGIADAGGGSANGTPTIDGDRVYAVTSDGVLGCLDAQDGSLVWKKNFAKEWNGRMMSGWGFSESPLVDGDRLICTPGADQAMLVALEKTTGKEIWKCAVPKLGGNGNDGAAYSSVVISNGAGVKQYVQLVGRGVIGVRASDGKFLWGYNRVANGTANIPTPLVQDDYVFCSTGYGAGAALLRLSKSGQNVNAKEVYFLKGNQFQNHHGGMVLLGDYVFAGHNHNNGFPICIEWKTGKIVWGGDKRGPGSGSAAITFVDNHLIFRYQSGEVALIEATPQAYILKGTFKPVFTQGENWAQPVVAGGRLYLRQGNKLMCYDVRDQSVAASR